MAARRLRGEAEPAMIVRDILKIKGDAVIGIGPEAPLVEAVSIMVHNDIGSLVVLKDGRMAGMLTFREVLAGLDAGGGALGAATVTQVMARDPVVAAPEDSLDHVRALMTTHHVRYLPVMESETLVGVISYHDVAKAALNEAALENRLLKRYIENCAK
jgi:CBS domain-containing protein